MSDTRQSAGKATKPEPGSLRVENLSKAFQQPGQPNPLQALDAVSFTVRKGSIFCILGPNGAGKTTLLKILTTLLWPDSGEAWLGDLSLARDALKARQQLGVVFQKNNFSTYLTVWDNLQWHRQMHGLPAGPVNQWLDAALEQAGLANRKKATPEVLSGGQQRRLAIIRALMHQPQLLFLDEPTTGLDPEARRAVWQQIQQLKEQGTTVILTTHYMDEAELLSDEILLLQQGRVVRQDTVANIKSWMHKEDCFDIQLCPGLPASVVSEAEARLRQLPWVASLDSASGNRADGSVLSVKLHEAKQWPQLLQSLEPEWVRSAGWYTPSLETVFFKLAQPATEAPSPADVPPVAPTPLSAEEHAAPHG